jgi:hypothetical protein
MPDRLVGISSLQNIGTANDEGGPGSREVLGIGSVTATDTMATELQRTQTKLENDPQRDRRFCFLHMGARDRRSPGGICRTVRGICGPDDPTRPELERGKR